MRRPLLTPDRAPDTADHSYALMESEPSVRISIVPQLLVLSDGAPASKPPAPLTPKPKPKPKPKPAVVAARAVARRAIPGFMVYLLVAIVVLMMSLMVLHSAIDT